VKGPSVFFTFGNLGLGLGHIFAQGFSKSDMDKDELRLAESLLSIKSNCDPRIDLGGGPFSFINSLVFNFFFSII
jgi:hypothetical protein